MDLKPNSLAIRFPELEKEWHPDNPKSFWEVARNSHTKYKWICAKGHVWEAAPHSRNIEGPRGCSECRGRKVSSINSLATIAPQLEKEWHPDNKKKFHEVSFGTKKKYLWVCPLGHTWDARPNNRTASDSTGCPDCSGNRVSNVNSLATKAPDLESEWHPDNKKKFHEVSFGSTKKCLWRCVQGHSWDAAPYSRAGKSPRGCPECSFRRSKAELTIFEFIKKLYPDAISGKRGLLRSKRLELDIYVPSLQKAVEYDGVYWHSSAKSKEQDQRKDQQCIEAGIRLLRTPEADYEADRPGTIAKILEWLNTEVDRVSFELTASTVQAWRSPD